MNEFFKEHGDIVVVAMVLAFWLLLLAATVADDVLTH